MSRFAENVLEHLFIYLFIDMGELNMVKKMCPYDLYTHR